MKKELLAILILIFLVVPVAAQSLQVTKNDKGSVIVSELDNAAQFELEIRNRGATDSFEIFTLVGVELTPTSRFTINNRTTQTIEIFAKPQRSLRNNLGYFSFEYNIKGRNTPAYTDQLLLKIVPLSEVFKLRTLPISKDDRTATVIIENTENTHLNTIEVRLSSAFFQETRVISLKPYEKISLDVEITKNIDSLVAGNYIVKAEIGKNGEFTEEEGVIEYLQRSGTVADQESEGFIIRETKVSKVNSGNTEVTTTLTLRKNIISRLFTTNSEPATRTRREGFDFYYTWEGTVEPGDRFEVTSTTNYTLPFIILLLIVSIAIAARIYTLKPISLNKKVSLVRTRGGELALKVTLKVKARKHVDQVQIIETLPAMAKLYEKFGKKPDRIDKHARRMYWDIQTLGKGEERIYSYIMYSKLKVVGRFELPSATAIFRHEDKTHEVFSNRAFFASEIRD